jgi:hypothetical protein
VRFFHAFSQRLTRAILKCVFTLPSFSNTDPSRLISQNIANNLFEKYSFLAAAAAVASKLFKNQNSDQKISLFFFLLSVGVENFGAPPFRRLGILSNDNKLSGKEQSCSLPGPML